ncbi:patatin [Actinocrispum sp. NPDC049592]|uniref:patatin n=1 Tax=Actinocrispum sp. NPDC049592 TaxID=3154835 RepID=UPI0034411DCC
MTDPDITAVHSLDLERPERYQLTPGAPWLRWTPSTADTMAASDPDGYAAFIRHSCDVTMRGGATSGVIYPLAVCALAEHYQFRNVGGASAGAIGAAATAAAEYGRFASAPGEVTGDAVRPGFAGLAGMITWLISGTGDARWRLPQLFQPKAGLHKMFRVAAALMQGAATTGRSRFAAVFMAMLCAIRIPARSLLVTLLLAWLVGPYSVRWLMPPDGWNGSLWIVAVLVLAIAIALGVWAMVKASLGRITLVLLLPVVIGLSGVLLYSADVTAWLVASAIIIYSWLLLTFAAVAAFAVIYGTACWKVLGNYREHRFGLIPGGVAYTPTWTDRRSGMPASTGVPPLSSWLADRIDDLAGRDHSRALTFGDLWRGPGAEPGPAETGDRVINLTLMTTDISASRPFELPFHDGAEWQFCQECLTGLVPDRIVRQMSVARVDGECADHPGATLYKLPDPAELPVIMAVRMSLPLPGLICPVPLILDGRQHWFSDGGITSNFPIHFFDSLLPRWPTFGLNLEASERPVKPGDVQLPDQDSSVAQQPYEVVGHSVVAFLDRILNTFLDWRDTMQAALPGFRGRIANIPQGPGEGGTNLFMCPEVIARLALRGHEAGAKLRERFTAECDGEAPGFTRTDRYRWIRMRLALREYREVAFQAKARAGMYKQRAARYPIPEAMAGWFTGTVKPPVVEPYTAEVDSTFDHLVSLADNCLHEPFDGTAPIDPVLRLTPPE